MDFVSLHSHSPFSFLDGASRIEELVNRAAELDMPALAITDHDNLCGAVKFYKGARKAGIKPIQGVEITMEGGFHLTLLARSPRAYASLCSLLTRSHLDNPRGEPAAAFTGLKELKEVIVLSGCRQGEINQLILQGQYKKACRRAREYLGILGRENFYIELQGGCLPGDSFINRRLYQLAQDLDIEMVASNNVHYACHQDFIIHDLLTCIRTLTRVQDIHPRRPLNGENYLKPTPEMKKLFAGYPKAVENTRRIAEECQRVFEDNQVHLPAYSERKGETSGQMLKRLVFEGARRRYGRINGRVRERLDREIEVIEKLGFADYFLVVADVARYARSRGIRYAGRGSAVFVFCGSALKNIGIKPFMDFVVDCAATPEDNPVYQDIDKSKLAIQVFKTIADPYIGRLNMFRVFSGTMKADSSYYNANKEKDERIAQLLVMTGKEQSTVPELHTGDIAAVAKLSLTSTGDTLCNKANPVSISPIEFPKPTLNMAIEPKSKGDEDKLSGALQRLKEEDPTIVIEKNTETKQTLLKSMGDTHVDIIMEKLKNKFGVDVISKDMRIPYRETIRATVEAEGKHKKQSGGHGQYGHVKIRFEPLGEGEFEFGEEVFGGAVPRQYFPAVEKGLQEAMEEGVLAGYPVCNIKATLFDGSYHSVDSSEMAFKMAARLSFRKGMEMAKPVLLEPIMNVEILVPEAFMGDIIGDLNSKRGRVQGMEPVGKKQLIKAQVPLAEMARYTIDLKSMTQGRGKFTMEYSHYEEVPAQNAEKIIERARQEREEKDK
jgi:hypothetical protein